MKEPPNPASRSADADELETACGAGWVSEALLPNASPKRSMTPEDSAFAGEAVDAGDGAANASTDKRSAVRELSGTGEAPRGGEEKASVPNRSMLGATSGLDAAATSGAESTNHQRYLEQEEQQRWQQQQQRWWQWS